MQRDGRGGGGVDTLTPKYLSGPESKAKRTRMAQTIGIPSLPRGDGESERGAGMGSAGGRPCCLPKNLSLSLCVCASQPTTERRKKILPPANTRQSAPLT